METWRSRASKRLCVTAFVVGDMVTDVCSHILGDITVKYSCESRFVDFDEHHHSTKRRSNFPITFFFLYEGRLLIFIINFVIEDEKEKDYKTKIKKIFYNLYNIWYIVKILSVSFLLYTILLRHLLSVL